jgi:hypothetical protein
MTSAFSWRVLVPSTLRAPAPVNLGVKTQSDNHLFSLVSHFPDFILELLRPWRSVTARRMFGGHGVYHAGGGECTR